MPITLLILSIARFVILGILIIHCIKHILKGNYYSENLWAILSILCLIVYYCLIDYNEFSIVELFFMFIGINYMSLYISSILFKSLYKTFYKIVSILSWTITYISSYLIYLGWVLQMPALYVIIPFIHSILCIFIIVLKKDLRVQASIYLTSLINCIVAILIVPYNTSLFYFFDSILTIVLFISLIFVLEKFYAISD